MTSRRGFLRLFGVASVATVAGVAVLDPDALLWRPGARLISIPAPRVLPFLAIGDIVTFGVWPERYVVTEEAQSMNEIADARFKLVPSYVPGLDSRRDTGLYRTRDNQWPQTHSRGRHAIQPWGPRS
jgi:hypothetical protein